MKTGFIFESQILLIIHLRNAILKQEYISLVQNQKHLIH